MITGVFGVLGVLSLAFAGVFGKDLMDHKDEFEKETNPIVAGLIGFIFNALDALGIGSFAPTTAALRLTKQIKDRVIPGTLNVACTLPVVAEAFLFIAAIDVDPTTLIALIVSATVGSYVGAGVVSKMDEAVIQIVMGVALLITLVLFLMGQFGVMPVGGEAIGLTGTKLIIGVVINFILGALMTAGVGLYAPCMAMVYLLGMSPSVAFPIMMGSCAFLMPVASIKFVKEGAYARKASLWITICGILGVFVAVYVVKSMPMEVLRWLVDVVVLYTAITLLMSGMKKRSEKQSA